MSCNNTFSAKILDGINQMSTYTGKISSADQVFLKRIQSLNPHYYSNGVKTVLNQIRDRIVDPKCYHMPDSDNFFTIGIVTTELRYFREEVRKLKSYIDDFKPNTRKVTKAYWGPFTIRHIKYNSRTGLDMTSVNGISFDMIVVNQDAELTDENRTQLTR